MVLLLPFKRPSQHLIAGGGVAQDEEARLASSSARAPRELFVGRSASSILNHLGMCDSCLLENDSFNGMSVKNE